MTLPPYTWDLKGEDDHSSLLECYVMSTGKQVPTFRRSAVPPSSGSSSAGKYVYSLEANIYFPKR
jgi:hypothetical protein